MNNPSKPISIKVDDIPKLFSIGRTRAYEMLAKGAFPARKVGRSTIVFTEDVERYLKGLPIGLDSAPEKAISARKAKAAGGSDER